MANTGRGARIMVKPHGYSTSVNVTRTGGGALTVYSDVARTSTVTMPDVISADKSYYLADDDNYTVSTKVNGTECALFGTNVGAVAGVLEGDKSLTVHVDAATATSAAFDPAGKGVQTPPAVPATTVAQSNTLGFPVTVYVSGGTVTGIAVNGTTTGLTSGTFRVPAGGSITLTYSVAPTWKWIAD